MIVLRNIVTAFLINGNDFLLSKRSKNKKIGPGAWYGVGGHIEAEEINDPYSACLREIHEETGIDKCNINNLKLKYIVLARSEGDENEIVINHMYFGNTRTRELVDSDEGKLYWTSKEELLAKGFFDPIQITLEHYLEFGNSFDHVLVGGLEWKDNKSFITWSQI